MKWAIAFVAAIALPTLARGATATPPVVSVATGTINVPKPQAISIAHYNAVGAIEVATVDSWMQAGTEALEVKDTADDVACPVALSRSGEYGSFGDADGFILDVIDSTGACEALRTAAPGVRAKIVQSIVRCGPQIFASTVNGCSDQGTSTILGTQIVIASSGTLTPVTLTHEFGHNVGNVHVDVPTRIMYIQSVAGRNEATPDECRNWQR